MGRLLEPFKVTNSVFAIDASRLIEEEDTTRPQCVSDCLEHVELIVSRQMVD